MTQHTPGPWFVHDFSAVPGFTNPTPGDVTVSCDHPATIAVASMDRALTATIDEARANARLIAAAPELLKQIKGLLGFANFVINELDIDTESTEVILKANGEDVAKVPLSFVLNNSKAAIAAAEGRS
jgi:hypothetical protein